MTRVSLALLSLLSITVPVAAQSEIGLAQGVSVRLALGPGAGWRGALLPVQADFTAEPGTIVLWHDGSLGPDAGQAAVAVAKALARGVAGEPCRAAFEQSGLRLRFPGLDEPVDGGSCGVSLAVAAISRLTGVPALPEVVFTGAIDEHGRIGAVGGLNHKLRAALDHGYRTFVMPLANAEAIMAAQPLATAARIRIVGVESLWQALFEAYGEAGPDGDAWAEYQQLYRRGLERLSASEAAASADCFAACLTLQPGDRSAQFWLAEAQRKPLDSLALAAALQQLERYGDAVREALLAEASGPDPYRIDRFLARARSAARIATRRKLLTAAATHGAAGRFDEAMATIDRAAELADDGDARAEVRRVRTAIELRQGQAALLEGSSTAEQWLELAARALGLADWELLLDLAATGAGLHDDPRLPAYEAEALIKLGDPAVAAQILQANVEQWPGHLPSRLRLDTLGHDRLPPRTWFEHRRELSLLLADPPGVQVALLLYGHRIANGRAPWPVPAPAPGPQRRVAVAWDEAGNVALAEQVGGRPLDATGGIMPAHPPYDVPLIAAGTWLVRPTDTLVAHPRELLGPAVAAVGHDPAMLRVGLEQPFSRSGIDQPVVLRPHWTSGVETFVLWGQLPDGPAVGPAELRLVRNPSLVAAIDVTELRVGEPVPLRVAPSYEPVWSRLVVGGEVVAEGPAGTVRLPAGVAEFSLVLTDAAQRHVATPRVDL